MPHAATLPKSPRIDTLGLSRDDLITGLRVAPETVDGWLSGARRRPVYFDLAIKAIKAGLQPIATKLVYGYAGRLGVEPGIISYWKKTEHVPVPARLAVAWLVHARVTGRG